MAGSSSPTRIAMMAITTRSSISVKASRRGMVASARGADALIIVEPPAGVHRRLGNVCRAGGVVGPVAPPGRVRMPGVGLSGGTMPRPYAAVFLILAGLTALLPLGLGGWAWVLAWPAASLVGVAAAYAGAGPAVFGKRPDGTMR